MMMPKILLCLRDRAIKLVAWITLLLAGTAQAEVWTCEMQPRVLKQSRHGEMITHTFTRLPPNEAGYVAMMENFTIDLEYNEEWLLLRENEHLIQLLHFDSISTEVESAVLFKEDRRAVKTLLMADMPIVLADQGNCEIDESAETDS